MCRSFTPHSNQLGSSSGLHLSNLLFNGQSTKVADVSTTKSKIFPPNLTKPNNFNGVDLAEHAVPVKEISTIPKVICRQMSSFSCEISEDDSSYQQDEGDNSVQVAIRVRPSLLNKAGGKQCVEVLSTDLHSSSSIRIKSASGKQNNRFTFDQVFDSETSQEALYNDRVAPLVDRCLEGYNATILAYGQTGSGKTHTIVGPSNVSPIDVGEDAGAIPRAVEHLFESLEERRQEESGLASNDEFSYRVSLSFLEIYGENIRDLLVSSTAQRENQKLTIRDLGDNEPEVLGATHRAVFNAEDAIEALAEGMARRVTGSTFVNRCSSRSHAIFSLRVEQRIVAGEGEERFIQWKRSKLHCVDLAGSERSSKTKSKGIRMKEGIEINKGLFALGNVISALGDPKKRGKTFVPYRDSKLTRLLKGCLGGNHKTLMIACISPCVSDAEESLVCLRYANRAKNIENTAVLNTDATSKKVHLLREQVHALASDLLCAMDGNKSQMRITRQQLISILQDSEQSSHSSLAKYHVPPFDLHSSTSTVTTVSSEDSIVSEVKNPLCSPACRPPVAKEEKDEQKHVAPEPAIEELPRRSDSVLASDQAQFSSPLGFYLSLFSPRLTGNFSPSPALPMLGRSQCRSPLKR